MLLATLLPAWPPVQLHLASRLFMAYLIPIWYYVAQAQRWLKKRRWLNGLRKLQTQNAQNQVRPGQRSITGLRMRQVQRRWLR